MNHITWTDRGKIKKILQDRFVHFTFFFFFHYDITNYIITLPFNKMSDKYK